MPLLKKHVRQIAQLARLELTSSEVEKLARELPSIIAYFDQIRDIPTESVRFRQSRSVSPERLREDVATPSMARPQVLANTPDHDGEFFLVPRVVDR